jgi:hypothetical protein
MFREANPISGPHHLLRAEVVIKASSSDYFHKLATDNDGSFEGTALPVGAYVVTVRKDGFAPSALEIVIASGSVQEVSGRF